MPCDIFSHNPYFVKTVEKGILHFKTPQDGLDRTTYWYITFILSCKTKKVINNDELLEVFTEKKGFFFWL